VAEWPPVNTISSSWEVADVSCVAKLETVAGKLGSPEALPESLNEPRLVFVALKL
jgi:hypothetical protein